MANLAGPILFTYYHDFWQEEMVLTNDTGPEYFEAMEMLREYNLEKRLEAFELWQDDPAFHEDGDDEY